MELEKRVSELLAAKDAEIKKMRGSLEEYMIKSEAARELAEQKGAADLLLPHVLNRAKLVQDGDGYTVRVFDEAGDPRGDGKGGFMGVKELVAEMKASHTFGRAFEGSGTGARPGAAGKGTPRNNAPATPTGKIRAGLDKRTGANNAPANGGGGPRRSNDPVSPAARIARGLEKRT